MPGLSERFNSYLAPNAETIKSAMLKGLVVLDTNVLLSAYRFAPRAREELLTVLSQLQDRLWIPDQVAFEFHKNRFEVIAEHRAAYDGVLEALSNHRRTYESDLEQKIRELANRAALSDKERDDLLALVLKGMDPVHQAIEMLRKRHGLGDAVADDPILLRLQSIFSDNVGAALAPEEDAAARAEADLRIKEQRPPGFKDASKIDPHGDYLVWTQTLREAKRRKVEYLVFVTGDVKEDWYLRVKGKTIMARPELAQEVYEAMGARLIVMQTKTLLRHARQHLQAAVSAETIRQAEKLPDVERVSKAAMAARNAARNAARRALGGAIEEVEKAQHELVASRRLLDDVDDDMRATVDTLHFMAGKVTDARNHLNEPGAEDLIALLQEDLNVMEKRVKDLGGQRDSLVDRITQLRKNYDRASVRRLHALEAVAEFED